MSYMVDSQELHEQATAVIRNRMSLHETPQWMPKAYREIFAVLTAEGVPAVGPPLARYVMGTDAFEVEAGVAVPRPVSPHGRVVPGTLPAGPAAVTIHIGPYEELGEAVSALDAWVREHGGEPQGAHWEVYFSDPEQEPDPRWWRTEVVQPYRVRARTPA